MRILHLIVSANAASGGPIEGVRQLGLVNTRLGHRIEVACFKEPGEETRRDFPLPLHVFANSRTSYSYNPDIVPWLHQHRQNYDAVIVNGLWQYNSVAAWRGLAGSGIPYFVYPHGMLDPWFNRAYPLKHLKKQLYWWLLQARVVRDARAVLFTCEEERRLARQSFQPYRCREVVVNYGTSAPKGDPFQQRQVFLDRCPEVKNKRFLLFLSRIHEKKGCDLLIQAFAKALQGRGAAMKDFHLVMAGPDQTGWGQELKELAKTLGVENRISWPGMLKDDVKWGAFYAADAFVLPSHQENFGIAVVEALACGLPVLISNQVNIWREILEDGVGLVEGDTLPGVQSLLEHWVDLGIEERRQMAAKARASFGRRFEIHQAARSLVEAIGGTKAAA